MRRPRYGRYWGEPVRSVARASPLPCLGVASGAAQGSRRAPRGLSGQHERVGSQSAQRQGVYGSGVTQ